MSQENEKNQLSIVSISGEKSVVDPLSLGIECCAPTLKDAVDAIIMWPDVEWSGGLHGEPVVPAIAWRLSFTSRARIEKIKKIVSDRLDNINPDIDGELTEAELEKVTEGLFNR